MNLRRTLFVLMILLSFTVPTFAQDDPDADFNTLLAALEAADLTATLAEDGPYTIFAPTDAAFETALAALELTAEELLADTETLNSILLYHVVNGEFSEEDIIAFVEDAEGELALETLGGNLLTVELEDGIPLINGTTSVFLPDVTASNGVVHVIEDVLLPPGVASVATATDEAGDTIAAVASTQDNLTTLVTALETADLVGTLSGEGPFTVFAPTNEAFTAALAELDLTADELLADTETLNAILAFHVLDGELDSTALVETVEEFEGIADLETFGGEFLLVELVDGELALNFQNVSVITPDVPASNGIIHIIDGVLLPSILTS